MLAVKDISKLLAGVPKGAWVALSQDEERMIAYAAELQEALDKAKKAGEAEPVVIRVPEAEAPTLLL
jgi:transaldolase